MLPPLDRPPSVEFHLLGPIDYNECLTLQRRLVFEASGRADGRIEVLLCEHDGLITVGRQGSRLHMRLTDEELRRRRLRVQWVSRSGGCILHTEGQVAVYPIVPLDWHGWSSSEYLDRLHEGVAQALESLSIGVSRRENRSGLWGRTGQLAALGVEVRDGIAFHGAYINVNPARREIGYVDTGSADGEERGKAAVMSSLLAEGRRPAKMTSVRVALIEHLPAAFGLKRYHLHTGHVQLRRQRRQSA
jgi:lipoyl(octanoyl) transferase